MANPEIPSNFSSGLVNQIIENLRKNPLKNVKAQEISEFWVRQAVKVDEEQAKTIAILWMTKILGADEKTANEFPKGNSFKDVGLRQAGVTPYKCDPKGFWEGVHKSVPFLVRDHDLEYLIKNDPMGVAAFTMISHIDEISSRRNLINILIDNAIAYK